MKVIIVKPFTQPYTKEIKGDLESNLYAVKSKMW